MQDSPDEDITSIPQNLDGTIAPLSAATASAWERAKSVLGSAAAQASAAGSSISSTVAAVGNAGATKVAETTRDVVESGKNAYAGSKLEAGLRRVDAELDQRGIKTAVASATSAVAGKLDEVTGKRLVELLETKLRVQDEYNDILATKLAEALDRIAKLEERVNDAN